MTIARGSTKQSAVPLHAFVVMPDHIHLLFTPQAITLERTMGLIKGGFSHRMNSKNPVWQRGFTDHRIRNREEYDTRRDYIHANPVRARLTDAAESYPYSSSHRGDAKSIAQRTALAPETYTP